RPQPRPRLRPRGAVRRHQAVRPRPRRRARRADGVLGNAVRLGQLVGFCVGAWRRGGVAMDVLMPQLGETVAEGKIIKWFKAAGDRVQPGDTLFETETDRVSMEVPAIGAGVLAEIRVRAGDAAGVGAVVAVIPADGKVPASTPAPAPAAKPQPG